MRIRAWTFAAWAAFTVAWFLPTLNSGREMFALRLSGWKAFLAVGTVAWDGGKMEFEWIRILSLAGVLSNVFVSLRLLQSSGRGAGVAQVLIVLPAIKT